ncbi:MAG: hypothetical protein INF48_11320 [Rhodobacter sp.]|nr:hypothetical protein [Rhodobacter sp.]
MNRKAVVCLALVYLSLAGLVATVVVGIALARTPDTTARDAAWLFGAVMVLPVWSVLSMIVVWRLQVSTLFLFWKYLQLVQWLTGLPVGDWFTGVLLKDHWLAHGLQGTREHWLYKKVIASSPQAVVNKEDA